jgi:hypothetical protein
VFVISSLGIHLRDVKASIVLFSMKSYWQIHDHLNSCDPHCFSLQSSVSADRLTMAQPLSPREFEALGRRTAKYKYSRSDKVSEWYFKSHFGVAPPVVAGCWELLIESKWLHDNLPGQNAPDPKKLKSNFYSAASNWENPQSRLVLLN